MTRMASRVDRDPWITAFDRRLGARALGIGGAIVALTLVVIASTDQGAPWAQRLGMAAALGPIAGAAGALGAARISAGRGELLGLVAIGVEPGRAVRGAVLGGVAIGALGALLAGSGLVDLTLLFPRPVEARAWAAEGASMVEPLLGVRVGPGGALSLSSATGSPLAGPSASAGFTALALGVAALGGPAWLATPRPGSFGARLSAGALALGAAIVTFQAVGAGRAPGAALLAGPLVLLIDHGVSRYLRGRA